MALNSEPMDIDDMSEFDNKENSFRPNNVPLSTEKGYEELDVSELNMKLRYSFTPVSSPMSKSYTANCSDNRSQDSEDLNNTVIHETGNLSQSLNSGLPKNETLVNTPKSLPLQVLPSEQFIDGSSTASILRSLDGVLSTELTNPDVTVTNDDDISLPSTSSSPVYTPEATTPVKDAPKPTGSPIMRGLKSVLNMFRSSQSPIPADENEVLSTVQDMLCSEEITLPEFASTPIALSKKDKGNNISKGSSPVKESIVFNEDLEKELRWKEETTIIFSKEKIPIHKLFLQHTNPSMSTNNTTKINKVIDLESDEKHNMTVEPMDISYNYSILRDKTMTEIQSDTLLNTTVNEITEVSLNVTEKEESVFLDCESTFLNETELLSDTIDKISVMNTSNNNNVNEPVNNIDDKVALLKEEPDSTPKSPVNIEVHNLAPMPDDSKKHEPDTCNKNIDCNIDSNQIITEIEEVDHMVLIPDYSNTSHVNISESIDIYSKTENFIMKSTQIPNEIEGAVNTTVENINHEQNRLDVTIGNGNSGEINNVLTPDDLPTLPSDDAQININLEHKNVALDSTEDPQSTSNTNTDKKISICINSDIQTTDTDNICQNLDICTTSFKNEENINLPNIHENTENKKNWVNLPVPDNISDILEQGTSAAIEISNVDVSTKEKNKISDIILENPKDKMVENSEFETTKTGCQDVDSSNQETKDVQNILTQDEGPVKEDHQKDISEIIKVDKLKSLQLAQTDIDKNEYLELNIAPEINLVNLENNAFEYDDITISKVQNNDENQISHNTINGNVLNDNQLVLNSQKENSADISVGEEITTNISDTQLEHNKEIELVDEIYNTNIDTAVCDNGEELILSENNSPFVSLSVQTEIVPENLNIKEEDEHVEILDKIENPFVPSSNIRMSPPICSKGYNIDFDEIENPFESKTKIRLSPPRDTDINKNIDPIDKVNLTSSVAQLNSLSTNDVDKPHKDVLPKDKILDDVEIFEEKLSLSEKCNETLEEVVNVVNTPNDILSSIETTPKDVIITNLHQQSSEEIVSESPIKNDDLRENFETNISQIQNTHNLYRKNQSDEEVTQQNIQQFSNCDDNDTTAICDITINMNKEPVKETVQENKLLDQDVTDITTDSTKATTIQNSNEKQLKNTSSSEQSTYFSAGTSDGESSFTKQYSLPDFDEINFNPFVTKNKMRKSPTPELQFGDPSAITNNILQNTVSEVNSSDLVEDVIESTTVKTIENKLRDNDMNLEDKNNSNNNTTYLDNTVNETVKEVHTEDEETVEGPFIDAELEPDVDKMSDFDSEKVELNEFTDLPVQENDDNFEAGEMFIDADAFEFLMNQNKTGDMADNGKESLFLKFDPLFAKRVNSDGVVDVLSKLQKRQSTPKKLRPPPPRNLINLDKSPVAGTSTMETDYNNLSQDSQDCVEDLNVTVSHKPTMAVTPAVNPVVTPRKTTATPTRSSNRLSMNFTSPAMVVIDRLLSLSGSYSPESRNTTTSQMSAEQFEADRALVQLRELLAEKQHNIRHLKSESKELRDRLTILESQMTSLEAEGEKRLKNINNLNEKLSEKNKANKSMAAVVEEYERTIAGLIAGIEEDKRRNAEERAQLINDRDEQTSHLASMEAAFNDLHSKYEKSKQIILSYKAKEDTYRKSIKEFEENLAKMQNNYELLKQHATTKLNHANTELDKINKSHEAEVIKLNAMIKRKDLHISSLEETLAQKTKANNELTAICDELINKVG